MVGLRKISLNYSRISILELAERLYLQPDSSCKTKKEKEEDLIRSGEYLCAKAILDGVISSSINSDDHTLESGFEGGGLATQKDLYRMSSLPASELDRRIRFCLNVNEEAVKGMRYAEVKKAGKVENSDMTDEELAEQIEMEMEEDE